MFSVSIDKKLLAIYVLEGLTIGLIVTSITGAGGFASDSVSEEKEYARNSVRWTFTVLSILVAHVIAESLRHDRILGLLSNTAKNIMVKTKQSLPSTQKLKNMMSLSFKDVDVPPLPPLPDLPPISLKNIVTNTTKVVPFNE